MSAIATFLAKGIRAVVDRNYRFLKLAALGIFRRQQDQLYLCNLYRACTGKELNLDKPTTFNEKLQWMKLYDRKPEYTMMVDKYLVRDYIARTIGQEYLIPLLGAWEDPEDIDFDVLPDQFVLKCNHNSGLGMCICKDKSKLDIAKVKHELKKGLKQDYYLTGREWPYKNVLPRIIAEQYMEDAATGELRDYKFFCFNGKVKCFKIDFDRFTNHRANYFTSEGNLLPFGEVVCPPDFSRKLAMPHSLKKMIELAEKLSADIPFLRVDFYEVNKQIYFGELTFFPASGFGKFEPEEWDYTFGSWIDLDLYKQNNK